MRISGSGAGAGSEATEPRSPKLSLTDRSDQILPHPGRDWGKAEGRSPSPCPD